MAIRISYSSINGVAKTELCRSKTAVMVEISVDGTAVVDDVGSDAEPKASGLIHSLDTSLLAPEMN